MSNLIVIPASQKVSELFSSRLRHLRATRGMVWEYLRGTWGVEILGKVAMNGKPIEREILTWRLNFVVNNYKRSAL